MKLRLMAHFGVFFFDGFLFALAFWESLDASRHRERNAFLWGAAVGVAVAVVAEVGKVAVPGRHLTWSETEQNVLGALCGAGIVYVIGRVVTARIRSGRHQDGGRSGGADAV